MIAIALLILDPLRLVIRAEPVPDGPEFQVNTFTTGTQWLPDVAADDNGEFVVVWQSWNQDVAGSGIFGQRFDVTGARLGSEFQISTPAELSYGAAVTKDTAGDFVVAWHDYGPSEVKARLYDNAGTAQGGEFVVGSNTPYYYYYYYNHASDVAMNAVGDFVVVWKDDYDSVAGRLYDDAAAPLGVEFEVSQTTDFTLATAVARNEPGEFVVAWAEYFSGQIVARAHDEAGAPKGPAFVVGDGGNYFYYYGGVDVGIDASGEFVVVWSDWRGSSGYDVLGRRYDPSGEPLGPEFPLSNTTTGYQSRPAVAVDDIGNFIVVWQAGDGSGNGIFGRYFDSSGDPDGGEFRVNTTTASGQMHPAVAMDGAGDFVVTWTGYAQDGSQWGIFGQRFCTGAVGCRPRVRNVVPQDDAVEVPVTTDVIVTFNEPVVPETVDSTSFQVFAGETLIPGSIHLAPDATQATFDPTSNLSPSTDYAVRLTSEIQDGEGDTLVPFDSSFRTRDLPPPQVPLPEVAEVAPGLATNSKTGFSTSGLGDIDGDEISDFISGAPSNTDAGVDRAPGPEEAGAAVVYFGSTDEAERAAPDIVYLGEATHDRAGVAVAGGFDFNGDTINDFMIGAEQVDRTDPDNPVLVGAGKAYLIYFDPTDTTHYPNINDPTTPDYVSLSLVGQPGGIPGVVFTGEALGDQAGFALAGGGMVNPGTGRDIAIGAPGRDTSGGQDAGAVYVIFDSDPALTGTISLADVPDTVDGVVYEGHAEGDALGFSVAFPGDVVEPAGEDIIMGAPLADVDTGADVIHVDAGIAYLGSAGTLSKGIIEVGEIGTEDAPQDGAQVRGDQAGEQFGYSVAGGGDNLVNGEPDTLIGAPYYDSDTGPGDATLEDAGRVAQLGGRLEKGIIEVGEIGTETDYAVAGAIYIGEGEDDRLGYSVAGLGDVTGDGTDDIGLGAPYADPGGLEDAGTIYIVEGYDDGTAEPNRGIIEVGEVGTSVAGRQVNGDKAGDLSGFSMAETGDIDGDGSNDFVAGSPGAGEGGEEDTGSVAMVLESENLVVTPPNQPPIANASATVTSWECEGELQATVLLDGSASSDPDGNIVSYEWRENGSALGSGVQVSHSFGLGSHPVTLEVRDRLGLSDSDGVTVTVADSGLPQGGITAPPAGTCFGPAELPVTVADSFTDVCDPSLTRTYDPAPGPSYSAHGDYSVTLTVDDGGGNQATESIGFTIDTIPPTVEWLGLPDRISIRPFNLIFSASDDDDAAGDVVREVMKLDGCVIYDGATFGPDPDGLLSDDVLRFSPSELCRIREECGFDILTGPELRVEATDCGGNVGHDAKVMTGRLILSNLPCAEPEEETRKESVRTPKRRKL